MWKSVIKLLLLAMVSFAVHSYVLPHLFEVGAVNTIPVQHLFLGIQVIIIVAVFRIIHNIYPEKSSFVFLGLLLLKMIFGFIFVKKMGWYSGDAEVFVAKAVFLAFYMVYLIGLLAVSIPFLLISGSPQNNESNDR